MNIETELVRWFNNNSDIPVFLEVPADRPKRFVTFEITGNRRERWLQHPTVAVQCWADSRVTTSNLAELVHQQLWQFTLEHPNVANLDVSGPYNFPDAASRHHRYQLTANFVTV